MTDAERAEILRCTILRADRILDWILLEGGYPEKFLTTAQRVRNVLQGGLRRIQAPASEAERAAAVEDLSSLPKVKLGKRALQFMKQDGILKEAKRK